LFLGRDVVIRSFETWHLAQEEYARMDAAPRALCDAFAAGVNYYFERNPQVRPRLLTRFEPWYILAWHYVGAAGRVDFNALNIMLIPANVPGGPVAPLKVPSPYRSPLEAFEADDGSNMLAVAPSRSVSGRAMLFINPTCPFREAHNDTRAHLESDEGLHISGFAILGTPYIRSGHNRDLGWSHTDSAEDAADLYIETFDDRSNALHYRADGMCPGAR
jgi:penicillin amidase